MASFHLAKAQNKQYDEIEELNQSAHDRFMARSRRFIEANPNAVSPWEKKNILDYHRKQQEMQKLRVHELLMLEQQGKNEIGLAEQKKLGMIGQGSEAAKYNSEANFKIAELDAATKKAGFDTQERIETGRNNTTLTEIEKKIAGDKDIAQTQADAQKSVAETKANAEKAIAEANQQTALAQQAMIKYKIDQNAAQNVVKIQQQLQGKDKQLKVSIINHAVANGRLDPNAAIQMIDEIDASSSGSGNNTGNPDGPRPMGHWAR